MLIEKPFQLAFCRKWIKDFFVSVHESSSLEKDRRDKKNLVFRPHRKILAWINKKNTNENTIPNNNLFPKYNSSLI